MEMRRGMAVGLALTWAGWWTFFAFAGGIGEGGDRAAWIRIGIVLGVLWLQPLLALRGTTLAGVALLLNAAALAAVVLFYVGGAWTSWLLMTVALPVAVAGLLTLPGRSRKPKSEV